MSQIKAKIIADSISALDGKRITTFELEYPRFIHSELMTHRMFSRNAASSRAIPVAKMIEQVQNNPATPVHWGKNQAGMQAKEELTGEELDRVQFEWSIASKSASIAAIYMNDAGAHKQIVNRTLEPFQWMKTVVTATEFENFFWLRKHEDAQPEIKVLAEKMFEALENNIPFELNPGEWHVPYVWTGRNDKGKIAYGFETGEVENGVKIYDELSITNALKISSSCCAQVSYRKLDDSLEKAQMIYDRLVESEPVHASPFEHQATPMEPLYEGTHNIYEALCIEGATHVDRDGKVWSGNFCGWVQHRQLIANNVKKG